MKEKLKESETDALNKCYSASIQGAKCYSEDAMREMYQKGADMMKGYVYAKLKYLSEIKELGLTGEYEIKMKALIKELGE